MDLERGTMNISHEIIIQVFRKILIPFSILFSIYRMRKNKGVTIELMFFLNFLLFLIFSRTHSFRYNDPYDIFDKLLIFIIYPICFLISSLSFFKAKRRMDRKEIYQYMGVLISFIIVVALYALNLS